MNIFILSGIFPESDKPYGGIFITQRIKYLLPRLDRYFLLGLKFITEKRKYYFFKYEKSETIFIEDIKWNIGVIKTGFFGIITNKFFSNFFLKMIAKSLSKRFEINQYDFLQVHWAYPHGRIANFISEVLNIPYILTLHGSDVHTKPHLHRIIKKQTLKAIENSYKSIFVSKNLLSSAINLGYKGKNFSIIGNGINIKKFRKIPILKSQEETKIVKKKKLIGFVGNLEYIKGADLLPDIFFKIAKISDVEFIIIGEGTLKNKLKKIFENRGLKVFFAGKVLNERLPYYYNLIDVLIIPSRKEGFGIVAIEANACGVYVVARDIGGLSEVVAGKLINTDEDYKFTEECAKRVVETLSLTINKNELIKNAHLFTIEKTTELEYNVYLELV